MSTLYLEIITIFYLYDLITVLINLCHSLKHIQFCKTQCVFTFHLFVQFFIWSFHRLLNFLDVRGRWKLLKMTQLIHLEFHQYKFISNFEKLSTICLVLKLKLSKINKIFFLDQFLIKIVLLVFERLRIDLHCCTASVHCT